MSKQVPRNSQGQEHYTIAGVCTNFLGESSETGGTAFAYDFVRVHAVYCVRPVYADVSRAI